MSVLIETAGHVPNFEANAVEWQKLNFVNNKKSLEINVPLLSSSQCEEMCTYVSKHSNNFLKQQTTNTIIEIIDKAIERLLNRNDPFRQKAEELLPIVTGFSSEVIKLGLTDYLKTFRKPQLKRFVSEDFSNPKMLDDFQPIIKGGFAKAFGPDIVLHIWAGNVPGLPLWSIISGLLVKAGSIGKVSSSEPLFASLFVKLLIEIEPRISDCIAIVWWPGGNVDQEAVFLKKADVVIAYGGNESLNQIKKRTPVTTRYLPYSHKISLGIISALTLNPEKVWSVAHKAANDIARYDQQGCYSPQMFFIEAGGTISPREFAQYIAHELSCFQEKFYRRSLNENDTIMLSKWINEQGIKAISEPEREIISDKDGLWTVTYSENHDDFSLSGLNRTIQIISIDSLEQMNPILRDYKKFLQTIGVAVSPKELFQISEMLGKIGVTRICALGSMVSPEAGWHHDGRFNLLDLIRLTEIENSAEVSAELYSSYKD